MGTLNINAEALDKLRRDQGLETLQDLAEVLGIHKGTASRIVRGEIHPGPKFIASVLTAFPVKFEDIFDIVTAEEAEKARPVFRKVERP